MCKARTSISMGCIYVVDCPTIYKDTIHNTILFIENATMPGTRQLIRQLQRRVLCRIFVLILFRMFIYFRYYENLTSVMVVSDVEMIKQILVKEFTKFNVRKVWIGIHLSVLSQILWQYLINEIHISFTWHLFSQNKCWSSFSPFVADIIGGHARQIRECFWRRRSQMEKTSYSFSSPF